MLFLFVYKFFRDPYSFNLTHNISWDVLHFKGVVRKTFLACLPTYKLLLKTLVFVGKQSSFITRNTHKVSSFEHYFSHLLIVYLVFLWLDIGGLDEEVLNYSKDRLRRTSRALWLAEHSSLARALKIESLLLTYRNLCRSSVVLSKILTPFLYYIHLKHVLLCSIYTSCHFGFE